LLGHERGGEEDESETENLLAHEWLRGCDDSSIAET
jgi:hypothetical protein